MRVKFWGVRGSLPVPGPKTERYGGNTSCVEVRSAAGTRIIIDAGTGIRKLGKELMPRSSSAGRAPRPPADQPHALGPHPGAAVLLAALSEAATAVRLRAQARRPAPARGVRVADRRSLFPGAVRPRRRRTSAFRELADAARVRDRRREGRLRAAQSPVHRDRLSADRRRRVGRLRLGHGAVLATSCSRTSSSSGRRAQATVPAQADRAKLRAMRDGVVRLCEGADLVIYDTMFTPETTGASRTTATRARATRSTSAARQARAGWCCFITRPSARDAEIDAHPAPTRATLRRARRRRSSRLPRRTKALDVARSGERG